MKLVDVYFGAIKLFKLEQLNDNRGSFVETFRTDELKHFGIDSPFVQENQSISQKNVLRGLHFQYALPQGKLIRVINGAAKFIEVDIRCYSKNFGKYHEFLLKAEDNLMLWVPFGFANGFLSLADNTIVQYKVDNYWSKDGEGSILWNDEELEINWGIPNPIVSQKDANAMLFSDFSIKFYGKI
jgi:dTDP-4-dehydrorhamnose 3,5-epimerase